MYVVAVRHQVDVFDSRTRQWTTALMPTPRDRLAAVAVVARRLACFGGGGSTAAAGSALECLQLSDDDMTVGE